MQDHEIDNAPPKTPGGFIDEPPPDFKGLTIEQARKVSQQLADDHAKEQLDGEPKAPEPPPLEDVNVIDLDMLTVKELRVMAKEQRVPKYHKLKRAQLLEALAPPEVDLDSLSLAELRVMATDKGILTTLRMTRAKLIKAITV